MEANDMKAMREALLALKELDFNKEEDCYAFYRIIDEALAKPPRNCDVGTAKQQEKRYMEECLRSLDCYECKLDQGGCDCRFHWEQMPYEEGGAK